MTKAEFKAEAQKRVENCLMERARLGAIESEADMIAGVSVVMGLVNESFFESSYDNSMDIIPPMWFMWPMSGRSIVEELKKEVV